MSESSPKQHEEEPFPVVQEIDNQSGIKGLIDESVVENAENELQQMFTPAVGDGAAEKEIAETEAPKLPPHKHHHHKQNKTSPPIQPEERSSIASRVVSALSHVFPFSRIGNAKIAMEDEVPPEPFIPPVPDNIPSAEAFIKSMKKMESHNKHNTERVEYYVNAAKNGTINVEDFFRNTQLSAVYVERK